MEEQAKFQARRPQVIGYLAYSTLMQALGRFCLDHQLPVNDHVETLTGNLLTFVEHRDGDFTPDLVAAIPELAGERRDVYMLQKTKSQCVVHVEERPYDRMSQSVVNQVYARHSARFPKTAITRSPIQRTHHNSNPPPSAPIRVLRETLGTLMPDEHFLASHRYVQPVFSCRGNSLFVSSVSVARNADAGVICKHPLETNAHFGRAVSDYHLTGVKGQPDANSAAVVE